MSDKKIQRQFGDALAGAMASILGSPTVQEEVGDRLIAAVMTFARADLQQASALENGLFRFVGEVPLRRALAQTFYGTRWLYKLGLALLAKDDELAAHIRAQVLDYGGVAEGLLSYSIAQALRKGRLKGTRYKYRDYKNPKDPITWNSLNPEPELAKQSFAWLIEIAADFGIVTPKLKTDLHWLRAQRNEVHLRHLVTIGRQAYLTRSERAFSVTLETASQTKHWCTNAP